MSEEKAHHPRGKMILSIMSAVLCVAAIGIFLYWWKWWRFEEYTDDAYVTGNLVYITPQVDGIVTNIYADDTWHVVEGQLLVELDKTDSTISLDLSKAKLAMAVRKVAKLYIDVRQKEAQIQIAKAEFIKGAQDWERRNALIASGGVSQEDLTHAAAFLESAYFRLASDEQRFFSLLAEVENTTIWTHPWTVQAMQQVKEDWVRLKRCSVKAPTTGFIAKRQVQVGERVSPADPLLAVVPLGEIWIEANYKENQIGDMQIGQKAVIHTDIYGKAVTYHGHVIGMGAGTGSIFSLLPPQNATGNWIKIVQRVPVRISLDPKEVAIHPLRLGLSAEVLVDIHPILPPYESIHVNTTPIYATQVFVDEEQGVDELIREIVLANVSSEEVEP